MINSDLVHVSLTSGSDKKTLFNCLDSLIQQKLSITLTLVNNCTFTLEESKIILEHYKHHFVSFSIINNSNRKGFSSNHNSTLNALSDRVKYVLLLNDDTILHPETLKALKLSMEANGQVGAVTPLLFYPDHTPQRSASYFPTGLHGILLALSGKKMPVSPHARQGTFWLRGVCLMLRLEALRDVGYLDEGFDPGYGEDIDLCYRLHKRGWLLRICPEARVVHFEGRSFGKGTVNWYRQSFRGLFRFLSRTRSPAEWRVLKTAWIIGLSLRWAASVALRAVGVRNRLGPPIAYRLVLADLLHTTSASTAGRSR